MSHFPHRRRLAGIAAIAGACMLTAAGHAAAAPNDPPSTPTDQPGAPTTQTATPAAQPGTPTAQPGAPTTAPAAPDPNAQLTGMLPAGFGADNCKPAPPPAGALAEVDCDQNADAAGPAGGLFWLWDSRADMAKGFRDATSAITLADCAKNDASPGTWHNTTTPKQTAGSIACGTDVRDNTSQLIWTDNSRQLMALVFGADIPTLNGWWLNAF